MKRYVYVVGTFDTKEAELRHVADLIKSNGQDTKLVSLSTTTQNENVDVTSGQVAENHPGGRAAVFTGDRGTAVKAMGEAFEAFLTSQADIAGVVGLGGSGGTMLVTQGMRALPVGVPKLMVSTMAAGDVSAYVGPSDITMMNSVTDVAGINRISVEVLGNAAYAIASMARREPSKMVFEKPAIGLSMFGVTTPCVTQCTAELENDYDCLVFHATGIGGQSMEKLVDSGMLEGVLDLTTTEVADHLFGGILAATDDRFGAIARTKVPYVGSVGALDMVNFAGIETVPEKYKSRNLYEHNPQITLMRTTVEENAKAGAWIADKMNQCDGPLVFLIPEKGVSMLDAPDMPFYDPEAATALFDAIEKTLIQTKSRRLVKLPYHVNDPEFSAAACAEFRNLMKG